MHVIAAKAVSFAEALKPEFKTYAAPNNRNARDLAHELQGLGFRMFPAAPTTSLAGGRHSPRPDRQNSPRNRSIMPPSPSTKNKIPFDARPSARPIRHSHRDTCSHTRGMRETEMRQIAVDGSVLTHASDKAALERIRGTGASLCPAVPCSGVSFVEFTVCPI